MSSTYNHDEFIEKTLQLAKRSFAGMSDQCTDANARMMIQSQYFVWHQLFQNWIQLYAMNRGDDRTSAAPMPPSHPFFDSPFSA